MESVCTFILAGGKGERLHPLTKSRAKPLLPFCGLYRLIDFTLANCARSGMTGILILTSSECVSLYGERSTLFKEFREKILDKMEGSRWAESLMGPCYLGTADAVRQNLSKIPRSAREVLILSSDHVYRMDYRDLIEFHRQKGAMVTVAAKEVDWAEASRFGLLEVDPQDRIVGFQEKPFALDNLIHRSRKALISMGVYVFDADFLSIALRVVQGNDFGHNVFPACLASHGAFAYNAAARNGGEFFWEDVGTVDSYWEAQMQCIKGLKAMPLSPGRRSPSGQTQPKCYLQMFCCPAGRLIHHVQKVHLYGEVSHSALSPNVLVCSGAKVGNSIVMEGAMIGPGAQVAKCIIDRGAVVPPFAEIGMNQEKDALMHTVSPGGIVVVSPDDKGLDPRSDGRRPPLSEDLFRCCPKRFPKEDVDEVWSGSSLSFC